MKDQKPYDEQALFKWWDSLEQNKGERAELRRCRTTTDVAFTQAFYRFLRAIDKKNRSNIDQLALIAGVLAHVKKNDPSKRIAEQMASPKSGINARVSGLRFRRLLKIDNREELYQALVRLIHLLDGTANIYSLAESAFYWSERTRKDWAYDYYTTSPQES